MDIKVRGGFGVREGLIERAGDAIETHAHNFPHLTYLRDKGTVQKLSGPDGEVLKSIEKGRGGWVLIEAGVWHRIIAGVDNFRYDCIYVHRDPDHNIVDQYEGWMPGYE